MVISRKRREASGVLCDKWIPMRLKGKFYKTVGRPAMMYGSECWTINRNIEQRIGVVEMRMLRWTNEVTTKHKISNDYIKGSIGVASIVDKMRVFRLRWLRNYLRREETEAVRLVKEMYVEGKRGRPK